MSPYRALTGITRTDQGISDRVALAQIAVIGTVWTNVVMIRTQRWDAELTAIAYAFQIGSDQAGVLVQAVGRPFPSSIAGRRAELRIRQVSEQQR